MSSAADLTRRILRHERAIVVAGIALLVVLSGCVLAANTGRMSGAGMGAMTPPLPALILMWWLMMTAMMLPSAAPAILLYGRVREVRGGDTDIAQTWIFLAAYLAVWFAFSIVAAGVQIALTKTSPIIESRAARSILLLVAGLYQISPIKSACLRQCRAPAQFIARHWRPGPAGAIGLGILHGAYCFGCCWMLMALLFVGGVMNFVWIAALTLVVGIEKLAPRGDMIGRVIGMALIAWSVWRLAF